MNKILLVFISSLFFTSLFAQNKSDIKGRVIDSSDKKPLELVTIGITDLKDSSFISYSSTTKTGDFYLKNMPVEKPIVLIASMVGYQTLFKVITLSKGEVLDLGIINLNIKSTLLNEVVVSSQRQAIVINKDTIEFRVEAFKVRPNAVVEELLKKLPGVQVDNDGTITVNGKSVSKLTIDGKDFFGSDPRIASKNLDADLLDKIQIYDDRENDPDHLIEDSKVSKIINLKFKKAFKKSIFGKVYAGGGSRDRFESGGLFNMFRDTLQISIIGVGNNLNKTGFSINDLSNLGGFNRSGQDALYNGSVSVGGRSYGGIEKVLSGGFNLNHDYGKKLKTNVLYFYNSSINRDENLYFDQQYLRNDTLFSSNSSNSKHTENKHNISGLIQWKPDTVNTIRYTPTLNFTDYKSLYNSASNRFNNLSILNKGLSETSNNRSRVQFQHAFSYYRGLKKKGESLNITHNLNINPDKSFNFNNFNLTSFTSNINSEVLRRHTSSNNANASANLNVTYRYPFTKKLNGDITIAGRYNLDEHQLLTFDQDLQTNEYDIFLENQSSDLVRRQNTESVKAGLTYTFNKKLSLDIGLAGEWLQIKNKFNLDFGNLNQKYFNLLPSSRLSVGAFSLSYSTVINQPSIYNLQPRTIQASQLYSFTGNPYLKPSRSHNLNYSFNKYYPKEQLNWYLNGNGSLVENSETTFRTLSNEGISSSTPVNRNGKYNFGGGFGMYKRFKKIKDWQISYNPSAYFYQYRDFFSLNQDQGFQSNWMMNLSQRISINWKDKIELNPSYSIRPTIKSYSGVDFETIKNMTHSFDIKYTLRWPKRVYWEGNYAYNYNSQLSTGFQKSAHLLNSSIALQMFKKDRGEIKLSCYDILDQNINVFRFAGTNSITEGQNLKLKRYFLVTYLIKFNKISTQ